MKPRRLRQVLHHQLQHAVVEHAHQSDPLGHRYDFVGMRDAAVGAAHPHEAFVKCYSAAFGFHHRFIGERNAPLVERNHDLVGGARAFFAQRVAFYARPVGGERAVPLGARGIERVLRAAQDFRNGAGVARRVDAADGHRHRHRAGVGMHRLFAHTGQQTLGGDRQLFRRATGQDHAELVAGKAAEMIFAAQQRAHALGEKRNYLLGYLVAVGFVEPAEVVDRNQKEGARRAEAHRLVKRGAERLGEAGAVHLAGERIEMGKLHQLALALVPLRDLPYDAVRAQRLAVGAGEPAAAVRNPDAVAVAVEAVLQLVSDAGAIVFLFGLRHRLETVLAGLSPRLSARRRGRWRSRPGRRRRARRPHCRSRSARRYRGATRRQPRRRRREFLPRSVNRPVDRYGSRSPLFGNAPRRRALDGCADAIGNH